MDKSLIQLDKLGSVENVLADVSLVRNSNVLTGDKNISDAFDRNKEWTNAGKDIFTNLGTHTMGTAGPGEPDPEPVPVPPISIADARKATDR